VRCCMMCRCVFGQQQQQQQWLPVMHAKVRCAAAGMLLSSMWHAAQGCTRVASECQQLLLSGAYPPASRSCSQLLLQACRCP
jgi:hypothetical protein